MADALPGPDRADARGDSARMNIGQVLDLLRPDFPAISIPKIRYWEEEGLIRPERTPSGYRKFSTADVTKALINFELKDMPAYKDAIRSLTGLGGGDSPNGGSK